MNADTLTVLLLCSCSAAGMLLPFALLAWFKLTPSLGAKRNWQSMTQIATELGLTQEMKTFQVSWGHPPQTLAAFTREIQGRKVSVQYVSYRPPSSLSSQLMGGRLPVSETWVRASIWPPLALGADEPSDPLSIRRGSGPGSATAKIALAFASASRGLMERRGQAAMRLMTLLEHPRIDAAVGDLEPHQRSGSDDEVLLVLKGRAGASRIQAAFRAAAEMATLLPELRRQLPRIPLDHDVARFSTEAAQFAPLLATGLPFAAGAFSGTYVALIVGLDVPLDGLGSFAPSAAGLVHRVGHHPRGLPERFNHPAVLEALAAFRTLPGLGFLDTQGRRLRFAVTPGSNYGELLRLAYGLVMALRHAPAE